jgi:hypothetical protein
MEKKADRGEIEEKSRRDPGQIQGRSRARLCGNPTGFLELTYSFFSAHQQLG